MTLGPEFQLLFSIRPRSLTGTLIHIGSQSGPHLSVYMEAGKVCLHGRGGSQIPLTETLSKSKVRVQVESNIIPKRPDLENNFPFFISKSSYHISSASFLKL